ncbi:MAG: sulfotransferase domain-containing protein [Desulfovermiculus sp.]|nr:sulfotransferase domain-containing protein [Desulfovermiculus sp.]
MKYLKSSLKHCIYSFSKHDFKDKKDILLLANRRGGSTWLLELLCLDTNIRFVDQPLSIHTIPFQVINKLPIATDGQFCCPYPEQLSNIYKYIEGLQKASIRVNENWRFWRRSFWKKTNRTLFKVVHGLPMINALINNIDAQHVVFIRHPLSQANSVTNAKWEHFLYAFLNDRRYCEKYLSVENIKFAESILHKGTMLEKFVLEWTLDKIPLHRSYEQIKKNIIFITYEEMILYPNDVLSRLTQDLSLNNVNKMLKNINKPSRTTKLSNTKNITINNQNQLNKWKYNINVNQYRTAAKILDQFSIDFYTINNNLPKNKYRYLCH